MSDQQNPETSQSTEAAPTPATEAPPEPSYGPGSAHFKQLAEVEKARRTEQDARKTLEAKYRQMEELVKLAANDYDRFSAVVGKPKAQPKDQSNSAEVALREVETLKRALEEREVVEAKRVQEAEFSEAKKKITEYVSSKSEKYPLTVALGFEEAVADMVHSAFLNGQVLSEDQAASEIEKKLAARKDNLASLFKAASEVAKQEPPTQLKPVVRTLTQSIQSDVPTKAVEKLVFEHRDARIESMVKALRNKLNT